MMLDFHIDLAASLAAIENAKAQADENKQALDW
jgi:hypothetical protein